MDAVILVKESLLGCAIGELLKRPHGFDELDAISDAPCKPCSDQKPSNRSLNDYDLRQMWNVLEHAKFLQGVVIEDLQDAVDVPKVAILGINVDRQPLHVLFVPEHLNLPPPPGLDCAGCPQFSVLLLQLAENGEEDVVYSALRGTLSPVACLSLPINLSLILAFFNFA